MDQIPGESFLISCLQKRLTFTVANKVIRVGKLILFRRFHYFIQMALISDKGVRENLEVPIPFKVEHYKDEGLLYFDYRLKSLGVESCPRGGDKVASGYFNKILEISVTDQ